MGVLDMNDHLVAAVPGNALCVRDVVRDLKFAFLEVILPVDLKRFRVRPDRFSFLGPPYLLVKKNNAESYAYAFNKKGMAPLPRNHAIYVIISYS